MSEKGPTETVHVLSKYPKLMWDAIDGREIALHYKLRTLARSRGLLNFIVGRAAARPDVLAWLQSMTAAHDAVARKSTLLSPVTYARLLFRR